MDKQYFTNQYRLAVLNYKTAHNEDEQWEARKNMARLERTASELFGFEFADEMHQMISEVDE